MAARIDTIVISKLAASDQLCVRQHGLERLQLQRSSRWRGVGMGMGETKIVVRRVTNLLTKRVDYWHRWNIQRDNDERLHHDVYFNRTLLVGENGQVILLNVKIRSAFHSLTNIID